MSTATAESYGSYDGEGERKPSYRRRNSVTRYSIVAQNQVVEEFQAHADIINQFRAGQNPNAMPSDFGGGGADSMAVASAHTAKSSHSHDEVSSHAGESLAGDDTEDHASSSGKKKKKKGKGKLAKGIKNMRRRFSLGM